MFTTDQNNIANGDNNERMFEVYRNRINAKNIPPGIQRGLIASNHETMGNREPGDTEQLEFKPGRKPKEAIEGDMVRFLYSNDDSIYWLQGRLNSRIDSLETAIESGG